MSKKKEDKKLTKDQAEKKILNLKKDLFNIRFKKINNQINKIEKTSLKKDRYSTYDDQFQWFLIPGILLLLLDFLIFEKRGKIDDQLVLFK